MNKEINILITGDYCPIHRMRRYSEENSFEKIFNDFLPEIQKADFSITNFETPATLSEKAIQKTGPALRVSPKSIETVKRAGFDLLTLANNHIMDYGSVGLNDTIAACNQFGISYVGVGATNLEAREPFFVTIKEKKFAFINIAENEFGTTLDNTPGAAPLSVIQNFKDINKAKESADFVIVIVHGGHEMYSLPSPRMVETYRFFVESGADAVVGHHTHCVSGFEFFKGKPIFYSLGNFVFDSLSNRSGIWTEGLGVCLKFNDKNIDFDLIPFCQNNEKEGVRIMSDEEQKAFKDKLDNLNEIIANEDLLKAKFEQYCGKVNRMYSSYLEPHRNKWIHALRSRGWIPPFLSKYKRTLFLNLIRCEAHRDVTLEILKNKSTN